jgi:hypothetical protein
MRDVDDGEIVTDNRRRAPLPGRPADPLNVLDRKDLTVEDKLALLKDWQLDLTGRMTATNENMRGTQNEGQLAEQYRQVSQAMRILKDAR